MDRDPVEHLCSILAEETRVCGDLAGVLREEQRAVTGLRADAILACVVECHALQDRLLRLAGARRALIQTISTAHGATAARALEVLPLLRAESQSRVRAHLRALRRALLETRRLERQNAHLAGASLDTVSDLLRALRALVPGAGHGADAHVAVPLAAERVDRPA